MDDSIRTQSALDSRRIVWINILRSELISLSALAVAAGCVAYVFSFGQFTAMDIRIQSHFSAIDLISNMGPVIPRILKAAPWIGAFGSFAILFKMTISSSRLPEIPEHIIILAFSVFLFILCVTLLQIPIDSYKLKKHLLLVASSFSLIALIYQINSHRSNGAAQYIVLFAVSIGCGLYATYTAGICDVLYKIESVKQSRVCLRSAGVSNQVAILFSGKDNLVIYDQKEIIIVGNRRIEDIYFVPPSLEAVRGEMEYVPSSKLVDRNRLAKTNHDNICKS